MPKTFNKEASMKTKTFQFLVAAVLTLAALLAGQEAQATTKTVTYTMTNVERSQENITKYIMTFTLSGNDPFDTSAPTTYTCTVDDSSLSTSGGAGSFNLELADGFSFAGSWGSGSNVAFGGNYLCIQASGKKFSFSLRCQGTYYYVKNVKIAGRDGTWSDTNYNSV